MIWSLLGYLVFAWTSCATPRMFNNGGVTPADLQAFVLASPTEAVLRPGDKITMSIWGHDNLSIGSLNSPYSSSEATGRWVVLDKEGEVNLPKIGRVRLSGFNLKEAAYFLEKQYEQHLQNPVVNVRVLNHYVTILGEVNRPGKYQIDSEKVTLLGLLGDAGGLTDYAQYDQVQLIRQHEGQSLSLLVDLSTFDALTEGQTTLQPDDIVYIPAKGKKQSEEVLQRAVPIVSILTGVAVLISVFDGQ